MMSTGRSQAVCGNFVEEVWCSDREASQTVNTSINIHLERLFLCMEYGWGRCQNGTASLTPLLMSTGKPSILLFKSISFDIPSQQEALMDLLAHFFPVPVIQHPQSKAAGQQNNCVYMRPHTDHVTYLDSRQQQHLPQTLERSVKSRQSR